MKALFINRGPRKNWSTVQMLKQTMKGTADAGAETELVNLYDTAFKGCVSYFACKLKNSKTNGLCAFKDSLTPILEKAHKADVIVIGSPIYFSYPTGPVRSFMERLMLPVLTYNAKMDEKTGEMAKECHYPEIFRENSRFLEMLFGYTETLCTYNTYQFDDYSKYDVAEYVEPMQSRGTNNSRRIYRVPMN